MKSTRPIGLGRAPRLLVLALSAALVAVAASGCTRDRPQPDVLLVTIDTLRSDHCSAYGYPVATTPTLERLASDGVLYRRAYAESATTAPSHAVVMTGRHFRTFGLTKNGGILSDDVVTLAEAMHEAGYETAGFVSSFPVMARFGFAQGFDKFDDEFEALDASVGRRKPGKKAHDRFAGATLARVEEWLDRRKDTRPLFLWVHFVDPHRPYRPPERFDGAWPPGAAKYIRGYDSEVHYADEQLGRLVDRLTASETQDFGFTRLLRRATGRRVHDGQLIVVTSDHGEGLGDHDWMTHGINLYEEAVRVPLVASWTGHLASRVVEDPVGIVDIAPGILSLLEIDAKPFAQGRDLFGAGDPARSIYLQRRDYRSMQEHGRRIRGEMNGVVSGVSKLIVAPGEDRRELYDLATDPRELKDLLKQPEDASPVAAAPDAGSAHEEAAESARKLEEKLSGWQREFPAVEKQDAPMDKETLRALRSLGYVE